MCTWAIMRMKTYWLESSLFLRHSSRAASEMFDSAVLLGRSGDGYSCKQWQGWVKHYYYWAGQVTGSPASSGKGG